MSRVFTAGDLLQALDSPITGYPLSIGVWCKLTAAPTARQMVWEVRPTGSSTRALRVQIESDGTLRAYIIGAAIAGAYGAAVMPVGAWVPIIATFNASGVVTLHALNESITASTAEAFPATPDVNSDVTLGQRTTYADYLLDNAKLGQYAIWSSELSQADIDAFIAGTDPAAISSATLVRHWAFADASLTDSIGSVIFTNTGTTSDAADNPLSSSDTTPPTLSNATITVNSNTAATFGATSNEDGTAHAVVRLASDPVATQQEIVDGTYANAVAVPADVAVTANAAYQFSQVTGLTGNTAYAVDQVATDAAGNISTVNTQTFTTQSKALRLTLQGGASKTLNVVLFDAATESTSAILKTLPNQVVAADGSITLDLNDTSIADGSAVEGLGKDASNGDPYPLQGTVTVQ